MKKLMILAAVAVMAIGAQAATVSWSLNNAYKPGGTATTDKLNGALTALIFSADSTGTYSTYTKSQIETAIKGGTFKTDMAASTSATSSAGGVVSNNSLFGNFATGDSVSAFLVIFDGATVAASKNFLIVDPATPSITIAADMGDNPFGFGNLKTLTQNASNWTATAAPEPTSGILLLLGMAGLALKRKRA